MKIKGLTQILPPPEHLSQAAFRDDDGSAIVHSVAYFGLRDGTLIGLVVLPTDGVSACEDSDNFVGYGETKIAAADLLKAAAT